MAFLKSDTPFDVAKHLLVMLVVGALLLFAFFFIYLPITTHHGETIVVPKVTGMQLNALEDYLDDHDLRYFVDDSSYNPRIRPFTVLTQDPAAVGEDAYAGWWHCEECPNGAGQL